MSTLMTKVGYVATLFLACVLSMAVAFLAVRGHYAAGAPAWEAGEDEQAAAERLQSLSRQLTQLTADYLNRSQEGDPEATAKWVSERFAPMLKEIRGELAGLDAPDLPAAGLLAAADSAGRMAAEPEREDLRVAATEQVLEATAVVDSYAEGVRGASGP